MSTESVIYQTAKGMGIPSQLAFLMVAQSKHETGNFTSNFFKQYNNAFGYSCADSKYQTGSCGTSADNGLPIGTYDSVADSTREVVDWIKRRQKEKIFPADLNTIQTPAQYAQYLKSGGYYGDTVSNYTAGIQKFFSNNPAMVASSGLLLFGVGLLAWYLYKKKK